MKADPHRGVATPARVFRRASFWAGVLALGLGLSPAHAQPAPSRLDLAEVVRLMPIRLSPQPLGVRMRRQTCACRRGASKPSGCRVTGASHLGGAAIERASSFGSTVPMRTVRAWGTYTCSAGTAGRGTTHLRHRRAFATHAAGAGRRTSAISRRVTRAPVRLRQAQPRVPCLDSWLSVSSALSLAPQSLLSPKREENAALQSRLRRPQRGTHERDRKRGFARCGRHWDSDLWSHSYE